jgi:hypothetical protein
MSALMTMPQNKSAPANMPQNDMPARASLPQGLGILRQAYPNGWYALAQRTATASFRVGTLLPGSGWSHISELLSLQVSSPTSARASMRWAMNPAQITESSNAAKATFCAHQIP